MFLPSSKTRAPPCPGAVAKKDATRRVSSSFTSHPDLFFLAARAIRYRRRFFHRAEIPLCDFAAYTIMSRSRGRVLGGTVLSGIGLLAMVRSSCATSVTYSVQAPTYIRSTAAADAVTLSLAASSSPSTLPSSGSNIVTSLRQRKAASTIGPHLAVRRKTGIRSIFQTST